MDEDMSSYSPDKAGDDEYPLDDILYNESLRRSHSHKGFLDQFHHLTFEANCDPQVSSGRRLPSLQKLCLLSIAFNIHNYDTLAYIPEMVVDGLLAELLRTDYFVTNSENSYKTLELFIDYHKANAITYFSFPKDSRSHIAKYGDRLGRSLMYVSHLDLSYVHLVSDDFLRHFADFRFLQNLNLNGTYLSSEGFRLLLSKHRAFKSGFPQLETLHLIQTVPTVNDLKTIMTLPKLSNLSFSLGTFVATQKKVVGLGRALKYRSNDNSLKVSFCTRNESYKVTRPAYEELCDTLGFEECSEMPRCEGQVSLLARLLMDSTVKITDLPEPDQKRPADRFEDKYSSETFVMLKKCDQRKRRLSPSDKVDSHPKRQANMVNDDLQHLLRLYGNL